MLEYTLLKWKQLSWSKSSSTHDLSNRILRLSPAWNDCPMFPLQTVFTRTTADTEMLWFYRVQWITNVNKLNHRHFVWHMTKHPHHTQMPWESTLSVLSLFFYHCVQYCPYSGLLRLCPNRTYHNSFKHYAWQMVLHTIECLNEHES